MEETGDIKIMVVKHFQYLIKFVIYHLFSSNIQVLKLLKSSYDTKLYSCTAYYLETLGSGFQEMMPLQCPNSILSLKEISLTQIMKYWCLANRVPK